MGQDFLSDIELFYALPGNIRNDEIEISGSEVRHITDVMRHSVGEIIFVTDGEGKIYKTEIVSISKQNVFMHIQKEYSFKNLYDNLVVCVPRLKSNDRQNFAMEKCAELGVTNFIVFESERSIGKGSKLDKWENLLVAAMKQSLRCFKPTVGYLKGVNGINKMAGMKIILDQKSPVSLINFVDENPEMLKSEKVFLVIGPEGGLSEDEINAIDPHVRVCLGSNRLRSETSVITSAAILLQKIRSVQ
ncbi:MAG: 16S rRNA (uracil(1498)-N(3))-methyltransferase [Melioribacteraceae bacterium]|nr:16S rRNA (uracil(1498)-N(3))-methyltransferase [Melioribacteraceae bacterium]